VTTWTNPPAPLAVMHTSLLDWHVRGGGLPEQHRRHVYYRSTDGVSFSAAAVAYTDPAPSYTVSLGGVSGGLTISGIVLEYNGVIYFGAYNATADTWGALEVTGLTTSAGLSPSLTGLYDSARGRHVLLAATVQSVAWARFAIFAVTRTSAGSFGTPTPYLHSGRSPFGYLAAGPVQFNGYWWLVFGRARAGLASSTYYLAASDDGVHWEDGYPLGGGVQGWLEPVGALTGDSTYLYLAAWPRCCARARRAIGAGRWWPTTLTAGGPAAAALPC
jgi:hypothetical protein